jgi:hypothetical protein
MPDTFYVSVLGDCRDPHVNALFTALGRFSLEVHDSCGFVCVRARYGRVLSGRIVVDFAMTVSMMYPDKRSSRE